MKDLCICHVSLFSYTHHCKLSTCCIAASLRSLLGGLVLTCYYLYIHVVCSHTRPAAPCYSSSPSAFTAHFTTSFPSFPALPHFLPLPPPSISIASVIVSHPRPLLSHICPPLYLTFPCSQPASPSLSPPCSSYL